MAGLTPGSGSVAIVSNVIQGNNAGAGDGGGIRLESVNGTDVQNNPGNPAAWYGVDVFNNIVADNITGLAGGGIALQDAVKVRIDHNTILAAILGAGSFSDPELINNIIYDNRSFYFHVVTTTTPRTYQLLPDVAAGQAPVYDDLAVLGTATGGLNPLHCLLTSTTGYDPSNITGNPAFVASYFNGASDQILMPEVTTAITIAAAFDEGGNYIDIHPGPLTRYNPTTGFLFGDYHITSASAAIGAGLGSVVSTSAWLGMDIDGNVRPTVSPDIGADQSTGQGDLNMDGVINATDLAILINYLNGNIVQGVAPFLAPLANADINSDGLVNAQDLLLLAAMLAG